MRRPIAITAVALAIAITSCSGSGGGTDGSGFGLYQQHCTVCHAEDGAGASGPAIVKSSERYTAAEMSDLLRDGVNTMPGNPGLSDDELATLVAYVMDNF